jgi:creatinine amidohydrolase
MKLQNLKWPEIKRIAPKTMAFAPIAALEQHGHHLPLITDTAIGTELAKRIERRFPNKLVLLPTLWIGSSHHHLDCPGTMSLSSATYIQVLVEMLESIANAGFRKAILFNCHGGNHLPASEALYRYHMAHRKEREVKFVLATYWITASDALKGLPFMETPALTHACEYETSMMLELHPDLVDMKKARSKVRMVKSNFVSLDYAKTNVTMVRTFLEATETGSMGRPELATRNKGRQLLDIITDKCSEFVKEFQGW